MFTRSKRLYVLLSIGIGLAGFAGAIFGLRSVVQAQDGVPISPLAAPEFAAPTEASLHNPGFDNHDWYFFHERYDSSYPPGPGGSPKPILPDDDNNNPDQIPMSQLQDWRLWYMRGTPLIQTFAEGVIVDSVESVAVRTYDGTVHQAGLYQVVYNTTPCLLYNFQMLGRSQPDPGENPFSALQVGIDQVGWHPDSVNDPAVPGAFPSTTVWGPAHDYKRLFGPLTVTVEARADQMTVFSFANALGGRRHAIVWDTGSLQDITSDPIEDPDDLPAPGGIFNILVTPGSTTATVTWQTASDAIGQIYYRLAAPTDDVPPGHPNKVYIPLIEGGASLDWTASPLNKTATTNHSAMLTELSSGSTYEYNIVSRGLSNGDCVTWVSDRQTFMTNP